MDATINCHGLDRSSVERALAGWFTEADIEPASQVRDEAITDKPWKGACATTGWTMDDFRFRLANVRHLPPHVTRTAVRIVRAYASGIRGASDVAYIANVIASEMGV